MKRFFYLKNIFTVATLAVLLFTSGSGLAQSTVNYSFATVATGSLTDMSSGTTTFAGVTGYNTASTVTPIGFTFYFMGIPYTQFSVNASGKIQLGATAIGTTTFAPLANTALLGPIGVNNEVKLPNGKVQYKLIGTSPNQVLIVEWVDLSIPAATTGTYSRIQVLLYEANGKIEYVYGTMYNNSTAAANSIFISSGTAANQIGCVATIITTPTYVTTGITNTTFAATSAITNLNSSADGSRRVFSFTPTAPAINGAPTWAATPIDQATSAGMRLNWNDNSTNETGFAIFRSLDDITYTYVATAAANATSYVASGLTPSTLYYWKVFATNEGSGLSTSTSSSLSTVAHGNITSITSGNWNSATTWSSGGIPAVGDNVTIANGNTVALDAAGTCYNLNLGNGINGILEMKGFTLTVTSDMTIAAGSTTRMNATVSTAGNISIAGNLTNNGTLDLYASATNYGKITFTSTTNTAFTLNIGSITNLDAGASRGVILNKGTTATPILDFIYNGGTFTVQSVSNPTVGCFYFINGTNGTLKISGSTAFSFPVFGTAAYTIPSTAGFWLNNPNFVVTPMSGSATIGGIVRITSGTFNVGNATGNNMSAGTSAVFTFEGGTTNIAGYFNGGTTAPLTISGGVINITTIGNGVAVPGFNFTAPLNITGGTINLVQKNTNAAGDYNLAGTITSLTGLTLNIGTSATAASSVFGIKGIIPTIVIDNTTNTKTAKLLAASSFYGTTTLNSGSTLDLNGFAGNLFSNITNNGSIIGTVAGSVLNFQGTLAQTYGGTPTSNQIPALTLNNAAGLTLTPSTQINTALTLTSGVLNTSGTLTLGNGGTTAFALVNSGGSIVGTTAFNLGTGANTFTYNGTSAQTTGPELPSTASVGTLIINNAAGVTLNSATSLPKLTLTAGVLTTSATNLLTVTSTFNSDIARTTGYINGPLVRRLPISATTGFYLWPLGKSAYTPFEIVLPTISVGTVDIKAEVFDANSGGTPGTGMSAINTDRYWASSVVAGPGSLTNTLVRVTDATSPASSKALAGSSTLTGVYNQVGNSINGLTLTSNSLTNLGYFAIGDKSTFAGGTFDVGNDQPVLKKLTDVANQLNNSVLSGDVIYELNSTYDGTNGETFPITFNQIGYSGGTHSVTIRVKSGAGARTTSSSSYFQSLINLKGASNIIFDGSEGGNGSTNAWTISNSSTAPNGSIFWLNNDASSNKIRYCNIKGASSWNILFGSSLAGSGNDGNTIEYCNIGGIDGTTVPNTGIGSQGTATAGKENSGNFILNNNIFDFRAASAVAAYGIWLDTGNTDWTITSNNLYQTTAYAGVAAVAYGIWINNSATGNNFIITNNSIGGSAAGCGGSAWTINGTPAAFNFVGIYLNVGNTTPTSVQNNTIANFNWTSTSGSAANTPGVWGGIRLQGSANIGTVTGNTIGSGSGTGSVITTSSITGANTCGIYVMWSNTGVFSISNNTIGSITTNGSSTSISQNFYGIYNGSGAAASATINNNIIGGTSTTNSINAATASTSSTAQSVYGIYNANSATLNTVTNNTIANLNNNFTPASIANTVPIVCGIFNNSTTLYNINGNTVRNLSCSANATGTGINASVIGIVMGNSNPGASISQNTVYGLSNSSVSAAVAVTGIHYAGPTTGTNLIDRNMVYGLSISSNNFAADLRGISFTSGVANIQNNMIRLGYDANEVALTSGIPITGLYFIANTAGTGVYFNSVSVGGTGVNLATTGTGTGNTYAFRSDATPNTRNISDNIFSNSRSNSTSTGKHFAVYLNYTVNTGLTINNNDYYVSGTGGMLGYHTVGTYSAANDISTLAAWKTATAQDAASISGNPLFTNASNLVLQSGSPAIGSGATGIGVLTDISGVTRSLTAPSMGAYESTAFNPTSGGAIAADQNGCTPFSPSNLTNITLPSGQTGILEYKWQSSVSPFTTWVDIATSNADNYTPPSGLTQTTKYKRLARVTSLIIWTGAAESNVVTMTVNPLVTVSISIAAASNPACSGTSVTYTATPSNGGTTPSYHWKVNNIAVGTDSPSYSYTPTNGDLVTCDLTSNVACPVSSTATSNTVTMSVDSSLPVSVVISPSANPSCAGTLITFTATPTNGGTAPAYQWKVNGSPVGTDTPAYSYTPANGDNVTCVLTSNVACSTGNPATSNSVNMIIDPTVPVSVSIGASANPICLGASVTFTATPTNGGSVPGYQWKKNGTVVGTNSATYTTSALANNDAITCILTSDVTCGSGSPATSNTVTMTVNPILLVSVNIAASSNPSCTGSVVTFTATPTNGGAGPTYQWRKGGVDISGETGSTYVTSSLATGDQISVVMVSNATPCASGSPATSNTVTMTVNALKPVTANIQATANSVTENSAITVCAGTSITFTSGGGNLGSAPIYQWMKNGTSISGATSWFYTTTSLANSDVITVQITSNITPCASGNPATSNPITVTVNPTLPVSVSIAASANPVCAGTSVTYTATPTNGGGAPTYAWYVRGTFWGTGPSYTYTPYNGDIITCVMTSNASCRDITQATSNAITMVVDPVPAVSIYSSDNEVCPGTSITFTALPVGGGATPVLQWYKNNVLISGATNSTYTYTPVNGDVIKVVLTSASICQSGTVTSNSITMLVSTVASVTIAADANPVCAGTTVTFIATPVFGGMSPNYQWYKNGTHDPSADGSDFYSGVFNNNDKIKVRLTSDLSCAAASPVYSNEITMTVNPYVNPGVSLTASVPIVSGIITICGTAPTVTFTPVPVNGGTAPTYDWYLNNTYIGTIGTFTYTPADLDVVSVQMTSNQACLNTPTATSSDINIDVLPVLPVSVSIVASNNPVCAGTAVTFTATPINGGALPAYQWKVNGTNTGTNSATFNYSPVNNDIVSCVLTSNVTACASGNPATSNSIAMVVNPVANVTIAASVNPVCTGSSVTFTATPINGGTTPAYQWEKGGVIIPSATNPTYSYTPVNGDVITVVMTSNAGTCNSGGPITSNPITMVVESSVPVSASIAPSANPVCAGTSVTLTATPVGGGTFPTYLWYKNASSVAIGPSYTFTPANGDMVHVVMTSNIACASGNPATSNSVTMVVNSIVTASVSVAPSSNPVCAGTSVTFTPTPVGGGAAPTYQWFKNAVAIATGATYTYVPLNSDAVSVEMTSNATCVSGSPATSSAVTMTVNPILAASVSITPSANPVCAGTSVTLTPNPVGGGTTPTYQWFKNTVAVSTSSAYSYIPVNGDVVYVIMTSNDPCSTGSPATSSPVTMVVNPLVAASVSIVASDNNVCAGTAITYTATPIGGGATPAYMWYKNSVAFSTANSFTDIPSNGDIFYVVMTSDNVCATGSPATSNSITMVVPALPSISVTASAPIVAGNMTVCSGTPVTFTPVPVGGGTVATYDWYVNYNYMSSLPTYTYTPVDGDIVYVDLTSSVLCNGGMATSSHINIFVDQPVAAAGAITGPVQFTPGTTGTAYSVGVITNATNYIWSYSGAGVTINGATNSVTLDFAAGATPGTLTIKGNNSCGNGAVSSIFITDAKYLNAKVFLEGPYNTGTSLMNTTLNTNLLIPHTQPYSVAPWNYAGTETVASIPAGVVDWVLVELRDAASAAGAIPATKLAGWPKAFFLKTDGSIVDIDGTSMPNIGNTSIVNNLYVVIRHRNHLAIMSANGMSLNTNVYSYDFTTSMTQAYGGGSGYKPVGSTFAMVSGDIDQDGNIFVSDYNVWATNGGSIVRYDNTDIDMDGNTFISDYNIWASNGGIINNALLKSASIKKGYSSSVPK